MKELSFFCSLIDQIDTLTFNYNTMVINDEFLIAKTPLRIAGLNLIEQMVLRYIYLYGQFNMSTLSSLANLKPSYLSRVTDTLQKKGFCEKNQSTQDQRVYFISLTKVGYSMTKEHVENLRENILQRFFMLLNEEEIILVKSNLILIIEYLTELMESLGIWKDVYPKSISSSDLFDLMDRRSKCTNKLILHLNAENNLPFFRENLNYYQNNIIFHLNTCAPISITALSRLSGFKLKHLSRTLKGLIERGLLIKTVDNMDKRVHYVELSNTGKDLATKQDFLEKNSYANCLGGFFDDDQLDRFYSAHKIINEFFKRF